MSKWDNITLFKFQKVEEVNADHRADDLERLLMTVCIVFDMTTRQVDDLKQEKVAKLIRSVNQTFASEMKPATPSAIGKYDMLYDVSKITLGQYVELAHFLSNKKHVANAHYVLASMSGLRGQPYQSDGHPDRAADFLSAPIEQAAGALRRIMESFQVFNSEYKKLFGLDEDAATTGAHSDPFNQQYGWIYSASAVAEYERIPLDAAYALPVRQA